MPNGFGRSNGTWGFRTSEVDLVVSGNVVTLDNYLEDGWIAVNRGKIVSIGVGNRPPAVRAYDASSCVILPGVIDGQTHAGSQFGFPGIEATTRSAVAGGVTTIVDMPYDQPDPVYTVEIMRNKVAAIGKHAYGDVALYATITNDSDLSGVKKLRDAGACAFKISSFQNHPSRFPRNRNDRALALLELLADTDVPTGLHNEDQEVVRATMAEFVVQNRIGPGDHEFSRPESAELVATATFLEMGRASGAHVHIVHMSSPSGFELVRRYQSEGVRATGEMCVHYLHFDAAEDIARLGTLMKVNPPIRSGVRDGLWDELEKSGSEFVSSDHSAWPLERKQAKSSFDAAAGVPGLETLLPAFLTGLAKRGKDAPRLAARYLSERPARFVGLWPRKGAIQVGADADFAIVRNTPWKFDAFKTLDGLNWSPYDGDLFTARTHATFVRGKFVWNGTQIEGEPGHGVFVSRLPS
jgi:allantoinase